MEILYIGLATAFTFAILKWKVNNGRKLDAFMDMLMTAILMYAFAGTITGMASAMVASTVISLYLLYNPFTLTIPTISRKTKLYTNITLALALLSTIAYYAIQLI